MSTELQARIFGSHLLQLRRELRETHGFTVVDLAEQAKVSPTRLVQWGRGVRDLPTREKLYKISRAWHLLPHQSIDLFTAAGHLPKVPGSFWQENREVTLGFMEQVWTDPSKPKSTLANEIKAVIRSVRARVFGSTFD